ncbi:MAG: mechanosensitive ion channel family protein [Candidatus Korobacteraceae bacterium]
MLLRLQAAAMLPNGGERDVLQLLNYWRDDAFDFLRYRAPRIVGVLIIAFILARLLRKVSRQLSEFSNRLGLPTGLRAQQLRTLSSVVYSVGLFAILFLAAMQILPLLGINMGPLLASAGVVGLAIGFGAQTLVRDFINGFFILVENQYDIGDTVKIAGVQGAVEAMTLRRTVLRDDSGALHTVPSSEIKVVSNLTRDWTQLALHISVAYGADSDRVIKLLNEIGAGVANDPEFADKIVAQPEVPGIDKVSGGEVDYLMLVKTKPGAQFAVSRELRRRIKASFEKNKIEPGNPNRVYVVDAPSASANPQN